MPSSVVILSFGVVGFLFWRCGQGRLKIISMQWRIWWLNYLETYGHLPLSALNGPAKDIFLGTLLLEPFLKPFLEPAHLSWKLEHTIGIQTISRWLK